MSLRLLSARGPALAIALSVVAAVVLFAALFLIPAYVEQVQGQSAAAAGLILLPQGLVMAAGTIAGDMLARRRLIKPAAVAGTMILAMSTGLLLLVQAATPGWLTALLLCGRGLALGLIIQPLLVATLSGLPPADLADANALFNIVDRVGGSFGVGLIASFFQASVLAHLRAIGPGLGSSALMTSRLDGTPAWRLLDAATAAFHDTVWLLVAVAGLAFALALLIPSRMGQTPAGPEPTAASRPLA